MQSILMPTMTVIPAILWSHHEVMSLWTLCTVAVHTIIQQVMPRAPERTGYQIIIIVTVEFTLTMSNNKSHITEI